MKIILGIVGLWLFILYSANASSQEIVMVKDRKSEVTYALVTSCETRSKPRHVRVARPEVGEDVYLRTSKGRHKCKVVKAIKIT